MLKQLFYIFVFFILNPTSWAFAACEYNVTSAAELQTALSTANGGDEICATGSSYGSVTITDKTYGSYVTVRSTTPNGTSIGLTLDDCQYLRFEDFAYSSINVQGCQNPTNHVQVVGDSANPPTLSGNIDVGLNNDAANCTTSSSHNVLIEYIKIGPVAQGGNEGRVSLRNRSEGQDDIILRNIEVYGLIPSSCADGIQSNFGGSFTVDKGYFHDITQGACNDGTHVDAIQLAGGQNNVRIINSYFYNNSVSVGAYDSSFYVTLQDNVFDSGADGTADLQIGGAENWNIIHNTFHEQVLDLGSNFNNHSNPNLNNTVKSNAFISASFIETGTDGCGTGCDADYNLDDNSSLAVTGANDVTGTASFIGSPQGYANYSNWQLGSSSPGYQAGHDSADMGATYYGAGDSSPPSSTGAARSLGNGASGSLGNGAGFSLQ